MKCPFCKGKTRVTDKRSNISGSIVRRRRECLSCKKRFTTYETIEPEEIVVIKKDGRREQFSIEKIKRGIEKACEKRPITGEQIEEAVKRIVTKLSGLKKVTSAKIGAYVLAELKRMDKVAYIRFASVYKEFKDAKEFKEELLRIKEKK